ncbi:pre-rRNA-processing protein TSR2 homolog [Physella acuta]|uniref:pre-rRNA-processing protein TSR2 homolog n=1 Tax=Physella acuta TaxID=109671 RepID=UPI0027DBEBFC|nr:pre-rRNA-processing protein TSR2 homolog [Physella acuta]
MACASSSMSVFGNAVSQLLNSWKALQLAVEHGFGGAESREKAKWLIYAIETWFTENEGIETFEVEDFLEDVLNTEFDLILEDNSVPEISRLLCLYYRLCQENKQEELQERLQMLPKVSLQDCCIGNDSSDEIDCDIEVETSPSGTCTVSNQVQASNVPSSSDCAEEMETSEEKPPVEDGWQVITSKKKKK